MMRAHSLTQRLIVGIIALAFGATAIGSPATAQNATFTILTASPISSLFGQGVVTIEADVVELEESGIGNPVSEGTVTFTDNGASLGTDAVPAAIDVPDLSVGEHPIVAQYNGTANFDPSSATLTLTVNKAPTTTTLSSSPNPSLFGQSVTFTAAVTPSVGSPPVAPTGSVTFVDQINGTVLGTAALVSGVASLSTSTLTGGSHTIQVSYNGDPNFNASASNQLTHVVNMIPTQTTLTSSLNPSTFGQTVTLNATVAGGGSPVTAGTVTFSEGATTLASNVAFNASGQATLTTSTLAVGPHTITATFSGTTNFATSVSDPLTQQIEASQADLSITKTDGVSTVTAGGSVTYTITASNSGPAAATGATVADTFPAALTGVTWTCVGAGGGTCAASGSGDIDDTVDLPVGGSVTYTVSATVDPAATGTLTNTATVTAPAGVTDPTPGNNSATDADTIDATPPSSTSTTTTTTTTTEPTTTTTTTTSTTTSTTSTTSSTSTSSTLPARVDTVTALTASPNPSTLGEAVTFTATVTLTDGGGPVGFRSRAAPRQVPGPDGGTLTISDGDVVLATVAVEDGQAAFTTSSLSVGAHTITAAFSGTAATAPSSVTIVQQVNEPDALPATR